MNASVDKRLLFAHFANQTTPLEQRLIEAWLVPEANQEQFYAWLLEWENAHPPYLPELDRPLTRFKQHMATPNQSTPVYQPGTSGTSPLPRRQVRYRWLVAASAGVTCLLGAWFGRETIAYQTHKTTFGETRTIGLADGSTVALNANSSLRVPRFGFGKSGPREVRLSGEAYFSVTHRPDNERFVVRTQRDFDVVVHGTEFTVSTFAHRARVMLRTGKVQVNYGSGKTSKQLMLTPGDLVTLDQPARPTVQHRVAPQPYVAFTQHRFLFDNMTLREFGQLLTDTYGLRVEIPDSAMARRTLVGSFRADNADELLLTVSELFDLNVFRTGNTVRLTHRD